MSVNLWKWYEMKNYVMSKSEKTAYQRDEYRHYLYVCPTSAVTIFYLSNRESLWLQYITIALNDVQ